jgi:hypothetical protein
MNTSLFLKQGPLMNEIVNVRRPEILDSRGNPTVEAEVSWRVASFRSPPCPRALRQARRKPPNYVTAIRSDMAEKARVKPLFTSTGTGPALPGTSARRSLQEAVDPWIGVCCSP